MIDEKKLIEEIREYADNISELGGNFQPKVVCEITNNQPQVQQSEECQKIYNQLMETEKDAAREIARLNEEIRMLKQVQQIVRTPEVIAYYKCCKDCGLNERCERENQRDCDEFLEMIDWLLGKQVE